MAYISIDVDMREFETEDLVAEIVKRLGRKGKKALSGMQLKALATSLRELSLEIGVDALPVKSIDDQAKIEVLMKHWNTYTSAQLEEKLK